MSNRRSPEQVKRDGWRELKVLAIALEDDRLTWPERKLVRQIGERLYGTRCHETRRPSDG